MGRIDKRLGELGLALPTPLTPPGNFQLVKVHDGLAYVAGHGPFDGPTPLVQGLVGRDLTVDEAYDAARLTALSILASLSLHSEISTASRSGSAPWDTSTVHRILARTQPWSTASAI